MSTYRQKLAASKLLENGGNISKTMKQAGYSAAMAKNPHKLTSSKGWQELMGVYLPDSLLVGVHSDLFMAKKSKLLGDKRLIIPDNQVRAKALNLAYKVRGYYKPKIKDILNPLEAYRNIPISELDVD